MDKREMISDIAPEVLLADGFDDAIIGVVRQFSKTMALYDYGLCVDILESRDGMSYEDAVEFMEYNVLGAWVGENTPAFLITT